jgi:hypothetical protein
VIPSVIEQRPATFVGTIFEMADRCNESVIRSDSTLMLRGRLYTSRYSGIGGEGRDIYPILTSVRDKNLKLREIKD